MDNSILIDDYLIEAKKLEIKNESPYIIYIEFLVTHEEYHDVTTLLYKNDFTVKVPDENIEFQARISNYSTSITNLYEEGSEGEFRLELIEK